MRQDLRPGCRLRLADLLSGLRCTLTWDQGKELALHAQIEEQTGMQVYFATPTHRGNAARTGRA